MQKAVLDRRTGDLDGAMGLDELAEPVLKPSTICDGALSSHTRGLVLTYQSEFEDAERHLRLAKDLRPSLSRRVAAPSCCTTWAPSCHRRGTSPEGLSIMLDAEDSGSAAGLPTEAIASIAHTPTCGWSTRTIPDRSEGIRRR